MMLTWISLLVVICARKHTYIKHTSTSDVKIKGQLISVLNYPVGATLEV